MLSALAVVVEAHTPRAVGRVVTRVATTAVPAAARVRGARAVEALGVSVATRVGTTVVRSALSGLAMATVRVAELALAVLRERTAELEVAGLVFARAASAELEVAAAVLAVTVLAAALARRAGVLEVAGRDGAPVERRTEHVRAARVGAERRTARLAEVGERGGGGAREGRPRARGSGNRSAARDTPAEARAAAAT